MKKFLLSLILIVAFVSSVNAQTNENWSNDFEATLKLAAEKKSPVLLRFTATWCGPCRIMEKTTLKEKSVIEKLNSFSKVVVDIDANPKVAEKFGVHAVPTFVALSSGGDEIVRSSGAMPAAEFNAWLNQALSLTAFSVARKELVREEQKKISDEWKGSDEAARGKLIGRLVEMHLGKESEAQKFATEKLKTVASENPTLLLDYLNDQKLAVRIFAGNLLYEKLGKEFVFDPWEKSEARAAVIQNWRDRLSASGK